MGIPIFGLRSRLPGCSPTGRASARLMLVVHLICTKDHLGASENQTRNLAKKPCKLDPGNLVSLSKPWSPQGNPQSLRGSIANRAGAGKRCSSHCPKP